MAISLHAHHLMLPSDALGQAPLLLISAVSPIAQQGLGILDGMQAEHVCEAQRVILFQPAASTVSCQTACRQGSRCPSASKASA